MINLLERMASTFRPPKTLVFIHIPKTAGSALRKILNEECELPRFRIERETLSGPGGAAAFPARGKAALTIEADSDGASYLRFLSLSPRERRKIGYVEGHFAAEILNLLPRPVTALTMLRDPVERVVSYYYFARSRPGTPQHGWAARMPLSEFAGVAHHDLDNCQTRYLCGDPLILPLRPCGEEMLEKAKWMISRPWFPYGLTENFGESFQYFKAKLGWKCGTYETVNQTPERPRQEDLPAGTLEAIRRHNRFDLELYKFAREFFMRKLRGDGHGR